MINHCFENDPICNIDNNTIKTFVSPCSSYHPNEMVVSQPCFGSKQPMEVFTFQYDPHNLSSP